MTDADKTIYKICREQAGYTQERAAELLSCSVRQLARYEAGEAQVPDDLAYAMVRLYNSQYLAVEHLRLVSQLAASIIPAVEPVSLQTAAIRLYNTVMDFVEAHADRRGRDHHTGGAAHPGRDPGGAAHIEQGLL